MKTRFAILHLNSDGTRTVLRFIGEGIDFTDHNMVACIEHAAGCREQPNRKRGEIGTNTGEFVYIGDAPCEVGWIVPGLGSDPDEWDEDAIRPRRAA